MWCPLCTVTCYQVQALARAHFGCPYLVGLPLEDVPSSGGAGSHWEARVLGPEVGRMHARCVPVLMCTRATTSYSALGFTPLFSLAVQLMSYGSSSGEVYLSDATLAFLEDTGATSQQQLRCRCYLVFFSFLYIGLIP